MKSYSNPQIVTISKGNKSEAFSYNEFTPEDDEILKTEINEYLANHNNDFRVNKEDFRPGIQMITFIGDNYVIDRSKFGSTDPNDKHKVFMIYTIPPYYTDTNVSNGEMSDSTGGVMFSKTIESAFEDGNAIDKKVVVHFVYTEAGENPDEPATVIHFDFGDDEEIKITGIMDTSIMSVSM